MVCAKPYGEQYLTQMWGVVLNAYKYVILALFLIKLDLLREAIERETDLEVLCEMLNGIAECVENFGETSIITPQDVEQIYTIIGDQIQRFEKRRMEREKERAKDEDADEDDQEQINEILELETSVLARISDVNHNLFMVLFD